MPVQCTNATGRIAWLPYFPTMRMGNYLRFIIAPEFRLTCLEDETVLAKVHTPDLSVVFNNECSHRCLKEFLTDGCSLIVSPWVERDHSTNRSLRGNARILAAKS